MADPTGRMRQRWLSYGDDPSQFVERYGDGSSVAVVLHGGFWRDRYDLSLMVPLCEDLARRGWTAYNVEYRRLGSGGGVPNTLDDVQAALDLIDAECVTIGHSAGGHLAAWLAQDPRVKRAVAQAGVVDLARARELNLSNGVVDEFLGGAPTGAASPIERLPIDAEFLLTHGALDDIVPLEISERFAAASGATLHVEPDEDHFGHIDPANPLWQAVIAWL